MLDNFLVIADDYAGTATVAVSSNALEIAQVANPSPGKAAKPSRLKIIINTKYTCTGTSVGQLIFELKSSSASGGTFDATGIKITLPAAGGSATGFAVGEVLDVQLPALPQMQRWLKLFSTRTKKFGGSGKYTAYIY